MSICQKKVKGPKSNLELHMKNQHENVEKKKQNLAARNKKCNLCSKKFTNFNELHTHVAFTHEGKRNFKCNNCDQAFGSKIVLQRHINIVSKHLFAIFVASLFLLLEP